MEVVVIEPHRHSYISAETLAEDCHNQCIVALLQDRTC